MAASSTDFELQYLKDITSNFSEDKKVGTGGYGDVYRAIHEGKEIAVKKLHSSLQGLDDTEFDNEFLNLTKIRHENVVRLIGYCYATRDTFVDHKGGLVRAQTKERVLCFEYMEGGSLDKHISDEPCKLDWRTCYEIIKGASKGLNHLHSSQEKPIFHMDLKPGNILLDKRGAPKIADLGLSKLVASTKTYQTQTKDRKGTCGYMPPEYIDNAIVSKKFDVFSLGVIMLKIMAGNKAYFRFSEFSTAQFIERVTGIWKERLEAMPVEHSSRDMDILRVRRCVEIALRCVEGDRKKRPRIVEIVNELDELETEIEKMSLPSDHLLRDKTAVQKSRDTNVVSVDPTLELRFLFEPRKEISCCLQLSNKMDGFIAFNIKINQNRYQTRPSRGTMPPCSKRYIIVTLLAQEAAPPDMRCHDMLFVQSTGVSQELVLEDGDIDHEELFEAAMAQKVVDVVKLPIVYVSLER